MRFVADPEARRALPPRRLFDLCTQALRDNTFREVTAVAELGSRRPSIKAGFLADGTHGTRVRPHSEGAYWTLVFDREDQLRGCVQAVYLSYFRAASVLLDWPHRAGARSLLVCGTGRLGSACAQLARTVLRGTSVHYWSPSGRPPAGVRARRWRPGDQLPDAVITATPATTPVPLSLKGTGYVGVGGGLREIDTGELAGSVVRVAGGGGGLDVLLAATVLDAVEGGS
ncbi:hypothetical protein [Kutzneria albida]|uniref:Ornithine cyclodeaminase/mu-crystallin n=1 Tax=Kutzneria albida DSM 43870 TaxID=1449976 RepID=W5W0L4_9PSEU|nr:hypothetical protein [Kutzneria albida]AHH94703.1 hypothetical protein KALB_1330 [Kutzneria albida DSM 43870]